MLTLHVTAWTDENGWNAEVNHSDVATSKPYYTCGEALSALCHRLGLADMVRNVEMHHNPADYSVDVVEAWIYLEDTFKHKHCKDWNIIVEPQYSPNENSYSATLQFRDNTMFTLVQPNHVMAVTQALLHNLWQKGSPFK